MNQSNRLSSVLIVPGFLLAAAVFVVWTLGGDGKDYKGSDEDNRKKESHVRRREEDTTTSEKLVDAMAANTSYSNGTIGIASSPSRESNETSKLNSNDPFDSPKRRHPSSTTSSTPVRTPKGKKWRDRISARKQNKRKEYHRQESREPDDSTLTMTPFE